MKKFFLLLLGIFSFIHLFSQFFPPQIGIVTIDTATWKNMVVWQRVSGYETEHYNVYREDIPGNGFNLIGSLPYSELPIFVDMASEPSQQSYSYKITAVNSFSVETDISLCMAHKTLFIEKEARPPDSLILHIEPYEIEGQDMSVF